MPHVSRFITSTNQSMIIESIVTNDTFRIKPSCFSYGLIFSIFQLFLIEYLVLNLLYTCSQGVTKENKEYRILIFTTLFHNSVNWVIYSIWYKNIWLFLTCFTILLGSLMCIIHSYDLLSYTGKKVFQIVSVTFNTFFLIYMFSLNFLDININSKNAIVNFSLLINTSLLVIPLASLSIIVRKKSVKTVCIPITMMNLLQSAVWLNYGMILSNYYLISVYCFGLIAIFIEILLYAIYNYNMIHNYEKEKDMNIV
jgi:hypothetical protein